MRTERMPYWNEAVVGVRAAERARKGGGGRERARRSERVRPASPASAAPRPLSTPRGGRTSPGRTPRRPLSPRPALPARGPPARRLSAPVSFSFSSSEKKGSWIGLGVGGPKEGVQWERSERAGLEEKATALEQSPKLRAVLRVVIFAPPRPLPPGPSASQSPASRESVRSWKAYSSGCTVSPPAAHLPHLCAHFGDAAALATPRWGLFLPFFFFFRWCVCVRGGGVVVVGGDGGVRTGDQPSKGLNIVDIFGIAHPPPPRNICLCS